MRDTRGRERRGGWQQTFTGRAFWPLDPFGSELDPRDIAHALSLQCRFAGHCRTFYSVADHSIRVAGLLPPRLKLEGLLHDAAEAYLVDLPRPVKRFVDGYAEAERELEQVIAQRFGLVYPWPAEVKLADECLLATEARDLMAAPPIPWNLAEQPLAGPPIVPLSSEAAEHLFLQLFRSYGGDRL